MEIGKNYKELAKVWLNRAKEDLKVAEILLKNRCFADSTYHSQQVAEKAVKALLILENAFVEEHIISKWFRNIFSGKIEEKELMKIVKNLRDLEKHWIRPKYPFYGKEMIWDPTKEYTKETAEDALKRARFVFQKISEILEERGVKA